MGIGIFYQEVFVIIIFIALELEEDIKRRIRQYVKETVKPMCKHGRWVDSRNYHLTLKYLGAVSKRDIIMLCDMLKEVVSYHKNFQLSTGGIGTFGRDDATRARVLWLSAKGDIGALERLRRRIEGRALGFGYKMESRFAPHITLARDVQLLKKPNDLKRLPPIDINVTAVSLMESKMEKGKRVYKPLGVYKLM